MSDRRVGGIHVQSWTQAMTDLVKRQPVGGVKMLQGCAAPDQCRRVLELNPDAWFVYRHAYAALTASVTDAEWDRRCDETLRESDPLAFLGDALWVELPSNEDLQGGADPDSPELKRLDALTVRGARRFKAHGRRPVGFNTSVGNLVRLVGATVNGEIVAEGTEHARLVLDGTGALIEARGAFGAHEYAWPGLPDDGWRMQRYWRLRGDLMRHGLDPDWVIGEFGYDRGAQWGQPIGGYRFLKDEPRRATDYAAFIDAHLKRYALDPKVRAVALFGGGAFKDFETFRYDGDDAITAPLAKPYPTRQIPDPKPTGGPTVPDPISRTTILANAASYEGVPYVWAADDPPNGLDCSAFVCRCWNVARRGTDTIGEFCRPITKDELKAGDAMNLTTQNDPHGYGHIRLFESWADAEHSECLVWEETEGVAPGRVVHRVINYDARYQPVRRLNVTGDDVTQPAQPAADVAALRDQAWAIAEKFEKAGQPWTGQAIKSAVALSKGER